MENYVLGSIILLIFAIVALIIIIVSRDRRDLNTKQISEDLSQLDDLIGDLKKIKDELATTNVSLKKHETALQALTQADGRLRQTGYTGANTEHRQQPAGSVGPAGPNRERQDDRRDRDRGPRQPGKGKSWGSGRPDNRRREYSGDSGSPSAPGEAGESITINDGVKYAKVSELAAHGLTTQEIAKRLNVGAEEVSLVLELKKK
jgi:hypothetical protein